MNLKEAQDVVAAIDPILDIAGKIVPWPYAGVIASMIKEYLNLSLVSLETGLAKGTVVADGAGGWTSSTNSRYDPKTGKFVDKNVFGF